MIELTWAQVLAWRLGRQHLVDRAPRGQALAVVEEICGLHAQMMSAAELALWARVADVTSDDVREALWSRRALVKTWAMRGTLHLLTAGMFPSYVAAARPRAHYRKPSWLKYHGVTLDEIEAIIEAVPLVLDGRCLTREELADEIARLLQAPHVGELLRSGWGALLKPAAFHGYLCFGPSQGQAVTFVRPDQWLGGLREVDPGQAQQDVLRHYLAAYGPAPREDFERWWAMEPRDAKRLFAGMAGELADVTIVGRAAVALAATVDAMRALPEPSGARLLPNFDPYVVALAREAPYLLPDGCKDRVYRTAGWISPVVLVAGRMAGVWEYEKQRSRIQVRVQPFAPLSAAVQHEIAAEAERLGAFLGAPADLTIAA
jgi:winged helix DNA-binding protein